MLVNCLNLQYSLIRDGFLTNRHALLARAVQTATQIELDGNLIWFTLLNRFKWNFPSSNAHSSPEYAQHWPVYEAVLGKQRDRFVAADVAVKPRLVRVYRHHRTWPRWWWQRYLRVCRTFWRGTHHYLRQTCIAECRLLLQITKANVTPVPIAHFLHTATNLNALRRFHVTEKMWAFWQRRQLKCSTALCIR